uniref:Uncharacterized protein n=1 Tax=Sphaerodactylus townsendi TaxID=933632 RepID=A0ACB8GBG9_9SAUR
MRCIFHFHHQANVSERRMRRLDTVITRIHRLDQDRLSVAEHNQLLAQNLEWNYLALQNHWLLGYALVDSGTSQSYMGMTFAQQHQVTLRTKKQSINVKAINDRLLKSGLVSQGTVSIILHIQQQKEQVSLYVTHMLLFPLVLGMDQLHWNNPQIDWLQQELKFG